MNSIKKKGHRGEIKKHILGTLALALILGLAIAANGTLANAGDSRNGEIQEYGENMQFKCYKSIMLEPGDTLWAIAQEYKDDHYKTVQEYIDELMEINGLTSDRIHSGRYLTVSYYEPCETARISE